MPVESMNLVMDIEVTDFKTGECVVLNYGRAHDANPQRLETSKAKDRLLRCYVSLIGETRPLTSPLSVDIANDNDYRIYRYDWIFGVTCTASAFWDWQEALRTLAVHLIPVTSDSGLSCSCVAANLCTLPPSRDTTTAWEKSRNAIVRTLSASSGPISDVVGELNPTAGRITKAIAASANVLETQEGKRTNWFIYQFLDDQLKTWGVEWRIEREVMRQYGPVLRGSLVLAFHGEPKSEGTSRGGVQLLVRPQMGFQDKGLGFVTPTAHLKPDDRPGLLLHPQQVQSRQTLG